MPLNPNSNYLLQVPAAVQRVVIIAEIVGVPYYFSTTAGLSVEEFDHYGDSIFYGDVGLVYGGERLSMDNIKPYLMLDGSSLTISQKLEPEQGRASVTQLSLAFIDKDGYMTKVLSPGVIIPDVLGATVNVYLGYSGLTFPSDFLRVFRGVVSDVRSQIGKVTISLSDPNIKRRQTLFSAPKGSLSADIDSSVTTIPVTNPSVFYASILGPNGGVDPATKQYVKIEDEFIQYTGISGSTLTGCTRGSRGTTAAAHTNTTEVDGFIQIQDNAMSLALKLMLSGWDGPFVSGVSLLALGENPDTGPQAQSIAFPSGVDVCDTYGLVLGDYITISGASNPANNGNYVITGFVTVSGTTNNVVKCASATFITENPANALGALRSQFDTLPVDCGLGLAPSDVDVAGHIELRRTFLNSTNYTYQFLIADQEQSGKTFIESEIYLPIGCYSLTKRGQLSVGLTHPPIGEATLPILNENNILEPQNVVVSRGTNNRKFFNDIRYEYDEDDAGNFNSILSDIDSASLSVIGLASQLPITSRGAKTAVGTNNILTKQAQLLLTRYKTGAVLIDLKTNWKTGSLIEAGDVVAVQDGGKLQLSNFQDGSKDLGFQLYEVQDRRLDMRTGNVTLQLVAGVGGSASDRFGLISPSSTIASGTTSQITIQDSYGSVYPGNEPLKWVNYVGQRVLVHSSDYTQSQEVTFVSQDPVNAYIMNLSPNLGFTPAAGYVLDISPYPTSADPIIDAMYKSQFAFWDPYVQVATGISTTQLTVGPGDAAKFLVGAYVRVHNGSFTQDSGDLRVTAVSGVTITVSASMGFTPTSSDFIDLIGFADSGGAYRIL